MADFEEWLDASGGGAGGYAAAGGADAGFDLFADGDGGGDGDSARQQSNRDAVLFCIDCHSSSFTLPAGSPPDTPPPFASFVKHAVRFYQEKIITSDRDLLGVVLFGTEQRCNPHGFANIYMFHDLDLNSAARVQELELLSTAATPSAALAADFKSKIGHADVKQEPDGIVSTQPRAALSELLWAILHTFNHLGTRKVAFKRAFLFTCDDDPTQRNPVERAKCLARARDLREHGIMLDVYGHGVDFAPTVDLSSAGTPGSQNGPPRVGVGSSRGGSADGSSSSYPTVAVSGATPTPPGGGGIFPTTAHQPAVMMTSTGDTVPTPSPSPARQHQQQHDATTTRPLAVTCAALKPFDRRMFWDRLVAVVDSAAPFPQGEADRASSIGSVHVGDLSGADFGGSLQDQRIRTYPQRALRTMRLAIGVDASAPAVDVQVFLPVQACAKPKYVWLEAATNALVTSETRLLGKDTGTPLAGPDLLHTAPVASEDRVQFTPDEVASIKKQFGHAGIRVLGFRSVASLRAKWNIGKSSFLAPNEATCGHNGLVLFTELHKNLATTSRYAIAEVIAREGAAPRLVALIPATKQNTAPSAIEPGSCGFHVFALPYADDYRSITLPAGTFHEPPAGAVDAAKTVVTKLSADYDPTAIANPALQRQYHLLQQLAVMDEAQKAPDDFTLPDREGMKAFGPAFHSFMLSWGPAAETYSPDLWAPLPKAAKPPPSAAEMNTVDMDALEQSGALATLTMPYLKQFLKDNHQPTSGAKKDLVERVTAFVQRRREKRQRDE